MARRHLVSLCAALLLAALSGGPARAALDGLLDKPLSDETVKAGGERTLRCVTYPGFTVRELHEGSDIGSAGMSILPAAGTAHPPCRPGHQPGERVLADDGGFSFAGARGRFLLLVWPDGSNSGTDFSIFDATAARKLYADTVRQVPEDGFKRLGLNDAGDTLALEFERIVTGPCSLAGGDAACWGRFAQAAKLPGEVAHRPAPTSVCAAAYVRQKMSGKDLADPSVISYAVSMTVAAAGKTAVQSRGDLSCWPAE